MDESRPFYVRRPRTTGAVGGLIFSPFFAILLFLFSPLKGMGIGGPMVFLMCAVAWTVIGALFPRIGRIAFYIGGNVLSNL